jgi:hypothetical protein
VFKKSAVRAEESVSPEERRDTHHLVVTIEDSSSLALIPYAFYNTTRD